MSEDRTYVLGAKAWHAIWRQRYSAGFTTECGLYHVMGQPADRLPPNGHLCGNCARIIAARTDTEV